MMDLVEAICSEAAEAAGDSATDLSPPPGGASRWPT